MSSHRLAIAKASFSASLLRPDPRPFTRNEVAHFDTLLNAVIVECTPPHIQYCKRWVVSNIIPSTTRLAAFGKYLTTLSTSLTGSAKPSASSTYRREPSSKRKRLHLLYLINDLLHHATAHVNDASIAGKIQSILVALFTSAASFSRCPKHTQKILDLLELWEERRYYSRDYLEQLRQAVRSASDAQEGIVTKVGFEYDEENDKGAKVPKVTPFMMPATHGDLGTPWYDLPAGNLMPHITPNSTRPTNPSLVKPLRFDTGPANENLVGAVKDLLQDATTIFALIDDEESQESSTWDIDDLGLPIVCDSISGGVLRGEGYYGWSKDFCERMMRRRKRNGSSQESHRERHNSMSSIRSRSWSSSPDSARPKQRSYANSDTPRGSRSRSQSRERADGILHDQSRSPSKDKPGKLHSNWRSRTPKRSRSRSTSPQRSSRDARGISVNAQSVQRRWSPGPASVDTTIVNNNTSWDTPSGGRQDLRNIGPAPLSFEPGGFPHSSSNVLLVPPPLPPPQFQGKWPPLPPLLMSLGHQTQQSGLWQVPPPPPPLPQGTQNWQPPQYGNFFGRPDGAWTPPSQQARGSGYGSQGRGASEAPQQQYRGRESGYGGNRGQARGRGW